ncbi:MAG: hypothetical protein CVV27_19480 [Candidatus Melainabacteria bacterium HGW-Melainabacteria-1]|nr:MAG: hypothetical protein CVV27_19480 [Candidatus Melainabacteria bacterium HGW-Melainabacteria-1]
MKIKLSDFDSVSICSLKDLERLIPANRQGLALNYGQGEGQFQIENTVWGIYLTSDQKYSLLYQEGSMEWEAFCALCSDMIQHIKTEFNQALKFTVEGALNHFPERERYLADNSK